MDKSKLPKPSGLRPPQIKVTALGLAGPASETKVKPTTSANKITNLVPQRLKRRSKSYSDLSTMVKPSRSVLKPLQSIKENKSPVENTLRRRSKSITDLTKSNLNKAKQKAVASVRAPLKRAAPEKVADESKAKVPKQTKLPDWDYKGRFQQLNERFNGLQEMNKAMKQKLSGFSEIEENYEKVQQELETLQAEHDSLLKCKTKLTNENDKLKSSNDSMDAELKILRDKFNKLNQEHEELLAKEKNNFNTINELTKDKTDLTLNLNKLSEEHKLLKENYESLLNRNGRLQLEYDSAMIENKNLSTALANEKESNENLREHIERLKTDLQNNNILRRHLHNTIQDLKGNIRVFCRVRPPINAEEEDRLQCSINYVDENCMEIRKTRESVSISGKPTDVKAEFKFDKVFPPECTQEQVFEELAQLVQSALDGYHVCVFAYGQTGSGKTYTMQGNSENPALYGMIPRTIDLIFETIENLQRSGWTYEVKASFLEIYNENIRDLLDHKSNKTFDIRFNEGKGTTVTNLTVQTINSAMELKKFMALSHRNRAVAATDFNEHSSRSHAVTKIYLDGFHSESNVKYFGSINLVDLAGSESAKTSSNDRLTETKNINKSLSTLGSVMLALYNKDNHVPYRNSKLTYLLQSCLGGNSKTLMFVNISPFEECYGESINSLRFAAKVKEVKLGSKRNKAYNTPALPALTNK